MATVYALGAAGLSFFGVIHGERLGWAQSWPVALGYLLLAALCALVGQRAGQPSERAAVGAEVR
jgi:AGZA family xanthine/uracil permease-like MFS transporter